MKNIAEKLLGYIHAVRARLSAGRSWTLLQDAIDALPDAFVLYDRSDRLLIHNRSYVETYPGLSDVIKPGAKFEDIIRVQAQRGIAVDAVGREEEWIRERMAQHLNPTGAIEHELSNGVWVRIAERRTTDGGVVGFRTDITEIKKRESELRASETRFRDFAKASGDWFWETDAGLRFTYVSESFFKETGFSKSEVLGRTRDEVGFRTVETSIDLQRRALEERSPFSNMPSTLTLPDGRLLWLRAGGVPIVDADGTFAGYRGSTSDITELVRARRALDAGLQRLTATVETALDAIVCIDEAGTIVEFNPAAESCFGLPRSEVIGKKIADVLIPPRFRHAHKTAMANYLRTGEGTVIGTRVELTALRGDGTEFPCELAVEVASAPDGHIFIGFLRDITDRREVEDSLRATKEAAEAANEAKENFLSMMSHEIRTPLNGVLAALSLLSENELDAEQRKYLGLAKEAGANLLDIISDVLDFAKVEAGKMELERSPFSVTDVIASATDIARLQAEEKGLKLSVSIDPQLHSVYWGDSGRVRQLLSNLISNAVNFTEAGVVEVVASAEAISDLDHRFTVKVRDTGIGIPVERQHDLFSPFVTVDPSFARKYGGTGLGLAVCSRLVEMMGGNLAFESALGDGSTFWFTVPLEPADPLLLDTNPKLELALPARSTKVLLAEDNPVNSLLTKSLLEKLGHRVDCVENGIEAVEAAEKAHYDIILMDVSMPEMDGIAATARIREAGATQTPIVALTAHAMKGDRQKLLASGFDDYVAKPIDIDVVSNVISRWTALHDQAAVQRPAERRTQSMDSRRGVPGTIVQQAAVTTLVEMLGAKEASTLVEKFIEVTADRLAQLDQAIESDGAGDAERICHTIAGSSANFGADKLGQLALSADQKFRQGARDDALTDARQLRAIGEATIAALRRRFSTQDAD
jgi:PAS domain S-box-containing protein